MSARTYIHLCPEVFANQEQQIVWTMSYMKSGRAQRWAERELMRLTPTGATGFDGWADFEEVFHREFLPANARATAVNKLEGTQYFQGTRPLDDYLDEFRELISNAKYDSSPATVVIKFRRGLDCRIVMVIAGLSKDRPSEEDEEGWYELAADLEQNHLSDEAFYTSPRTVTLITATTTCGVINLPRPTPATFVCPPPPSAIPVPTESKRKSDTCRRCGETGHWASECKLKYDIRYMSAEEIQSATEDHMAQLDITGRIQEEEVQAETGAEIVPEDFGSSSR